MRQPAQALAETTRELAERGVREVLDRVATGEQLILVDAPPGSGKTTLTERTAVQERRRGQSVAIVTQTKSQARDLLRRLGRRDPDRPVHAFTTRQDRLPPELERMPNVLDVKTLDHLPAGPAIVVSNAWKWRYTERRFDLAIVDEAYQMQDMALGVIGFLFDRLVLVGDPGQIRPFTEAATERWRSDPAGPHVPAPRALIVRRPGTPRIGLPASFRLTQDTVAFVQPAFYPDLPFGSASPPGERSLVAECLGVSPADRAIDRLIEGDSLMQLNLPERITGPYDPEVATLIVTTLEQLVSRGIRAVDGDTSYRLAPSHLGVVCAHVDQVAAVQERLPAGFDDVLVETANRFQGLERDVVVVHHPLSGRAEPTSFHLEAGRMCVMVSRHRIGCIVVSRDGVERRLRAYAPEGERALRIPDDPEYAGWSAHLKLLTALNQSGRVLSVA